MLRSRSAENESGTEIGQSRSTAVLVYTEVLRVVLFLRSRMPGTESGTEIAHCSQVDGPRAVPGQASDPGTLYHTRLRASYALSGTDVADTSCPVRVYCMVLSAH